MDEDRPPVREGHPDRAASMQAWQLLAQPLLFLVHFGAVYGWVGLACAFRWGAGNALLGPVGLAGAGVLLLTAGAVAAAFWLRPRAVAERPDERRLAYDPDERAHFMTATARGVGWLAVAGMLAVGAMALLAPTCGPAP